MKKVFILSITGLIFITSGYSQDSARTTNDKPGTPQSLRTINTAPKSKVQVVNTNITPGQTINHGATESNGANNKQEQTITTTSDAGNGKAIPQSPVINNPADSTTNGINNRKTNVTNPIRK